MNWSKCHLLQIKSTEKETHRHLPMKIRSPRDPRIPFEANISHDIVIPDIHYDGKVFNLSDGGIYFESNERIEPGDEISITVKREDGTAITFDVEIIRRENIERSGYNFGYGAKSIDPEKKLVKIIVKALTKSKDRRQHIRLDYNKIARFRHGGENLRVWIKDISPGGVFIQTGIKLPLGKRLILNMGGKKTGYISRKGRIVRTNETGFGIKFDLYKIFFNRIQKER
jgi:hypothetical protein